MADQMAGPRVELKAALPHNATVWRALFRCAPHSRETIVDHRATPYDGVASPPPGGGRAGWSGPVEAP
jgi:hypothetical protein